MPFHFHDKLKNEIQNTMLTFVFNTNNGNGNSINCRFFNVLSIFYSDFQIFSFAFHFYKKTKNEIQYLFFAFHFQRKNKKRNTTNTSDFIFQ